MDIAPRDDSATSASAAAPGNLRDAVRVEFLGAAGFVTGSRTLLEYNGFRVYVDCGLYQGPKYVEARNYLPLESAPQTIDAIVLTHAHIDHSGLIPRLVREGFTGKIFCTKPTKKLLEIILPDAGKLQEEEYRQLSRGELKKYALEAPLFTREDGKAALDFVRSVDYNRDFKVGPFLVRYTWAGHILGAAHTNVWLPAKVRGTKKIEKFSMLFSGDIGPESTFFHKPLKRPKIAQNVVIESTYGDRMRTEEDYEKKIGDAVRYVVERKGMLVMPAFAVGRVQIVLYVLYRLLRAKKIPTLRIAVDSPMAIKATKAYMRFRSELTSEVAKSGFFEFLRSKNVLMVKDAEESKALVEAAGPMVVVSASGMCTGGRVMHHLEHRLGDTRNYILFTGYAGEGTLAHQIMTGANRVQIYGKEVPVRAMVAQLQSFSAHADLAGLIDWMRPFKDKGVERIYINHGEDAARENLARELAFMKADIELPRYQSTYYLHS
ncbi:MAG: MBL fold metallo-hydrolase [Spirochaetes bacterium]|nr:MBL fold metallo-hydrolase [Spirochaetota bacterium]